MDGSVVSADLAWTAERSLLRADIRRDRAALEALLAPDFHEIGQSGRHWTRIEIIDALTVESLSPADSAIDEQQAQMLDRGLVLLTYRLRVGAHGSRRSSIWRIEGERAQLVFHQGTAIRST